MPDSPMLRRQITSAEAEILGEHLFLQAKEKLGISADFTISRDAWLEAMELVKRAMKITAPTPGELAGRKPARRRKPDSSS